MCMQRAIRSLQVKIISRGWLEAPKRKKQRCTKLRDTILISLFDIKVCNEKCKPSAQNARVVALMYTGRAISRWSQFLALTQASCISG